MHSLVKGIILSVWIWFIIKVSEKVSGNTKHQIQNEFLYYFIWLWHSYGEISILGLLCAIGVQITDIVIAILCLFSDISKELLGACWVTSLIVVLFVSGGVGIEKMVGKNRNVFDKYSCIFWSSIFPISNVTIYIQILKGRF